MSLKIGDLIPIGGKGGDLLFAYGLKIEGISILGKVLSAEYTFVSQYPELEQGTTFQWFRGEDRYGEFAEIEGATNKEYTLVEDDVDNYIKVIVTVSDTAGRKGLAIPMWSDNAIVDVDDTSGSPGSPKLIAGNMEQGYFGVVPSSQLITGNALASMVGISAGTSQFSSEGWLKFAYQGIIQFVAKKPIRHSISWDRINSANCIYGAKTVTIGGLTYKVRLMRGANKDPAGYFSGSINHNSEWNKLMLPIHIEAKNKNWAHPLNVETDVPYWGIDFTDTDLCTHSSVGNGAYSWCQEVAETSGSRILRSFFGVSDSYSSGSYTAASNRGWRPVLRLV